MDGSPVASRFRTDLPGPIANIYPALPNENWGAQMGNPLAHASIAGHLQELHFGGLMVGCRASSRGPLDRRSFAVGFCLLARRCLAWRPAPLTCLCRRRPRRQPEHPPSPCRNSESESKAASNTPVFGSLQLPDLIDKQNTASDVWADTDSLRHRLALRLLAMDLTAQSLLGQMPLVLGRAVSGPGRKLKSASPISATT
jgi:hypothetical protein